MGSHYYKQHWHPQSMLLSISFNQAYDQAVKDALNSLLHFPTFSQNSQTLQKTSCRPRACSESLARWEMFMRHFNQGTQGYNTQYSSLIRTSILIKLSYMALTYTLYNALFDKRLLVIQEKTKCMLVFATGAALILETAYILLKVGKVFLTSFFQKLPFSSSCVHIWQVQIMLTHFNVHHSTPTRWWIEVTDPTMHHDLKRV